LSKPRSKQSVLGLAARAIIVVLVVGLLVLVVKTHEAKPAARASAPPVLFPLDTPSVGGPGTVKIGSTVHYVVVVSSLSQRKLKGVELTIPAYQVRSQLRFRRRGTDLLVAKLPSLIPRKAQLYDLWLVVPPKPVNPGPGPLRFCLPVTLNLAGDPVRTTEARLCSKPVP
jgi:hypothetical protein